MSDHLYNIGVGYPFQEIIQHKAFIQFCLLNGVRHSEMNLIPKTGINWEARQVRIRQGITPKFYRILREACERAGVPYGRGTRDGLVLHDARHTATTHLLESNVSPKTVQEWMGWSDKAFVLYYSHATKRSREEAGQSLEKLAGQKTA